MKKRLFCVFLALALTAALFAGVQLPAYSQTESGLTYTVTGGNATITKYSGSATALTVPEIIDTYPVTAIGYRAFIGCTTITSLSLPTGLTSLSGSAFEGCTGLTSISIPSEITYLPDYVFYGCTALETVTLSSELERIGCEAFGGCTSLASIDIPDNVTVVDSGAFLNCSDLSEVDISCNIETISDFMFSGCESLISVTLPDSVSMIGMSAFSDCTALSQIRIPESVETIMPDAFFGCSGLTVFGVSGSVAETMANENGFTFMDIDNITASASISGTAQYSKTLTAVPKDFPSGAVLHYQWKLDGANVGGDRATYVVYLVAIGKSVTVTISDENGHSATSEAVVPTKCPQSTPDTPTLSSKADTMVTLTALNGREYSCDGVNWQDSNVFENLMQDTEYRFYVRMEGSDRYEASASSPALTVFTEKTNTPITVTISDTATYATAVTATVSGAPEGATLSYQWYVGGSPVGKDLNSYTVYSAAFDKLIYCNVTINGTQTIRSGGYICKPGQKTPPAAPEFISRTFNSITVKTVLGCEYSIDGKQWQTTGEFSDLTPGTIYYIYTRRPGTSNYSPSIARKLKAITALETSDFTVTLAGTGAYATALTAIISGIDLTGKTVTYQWQRGDIAVGGNSPTYTCYLADIDQEVTVTVIVGSKSAISTSVTGRKAANNPSETPRLWSKTDSTITVVTFAGREYSVDGINWQKSATFTGLSSGTEYNVYMRRGESKAYLPGSASIPLSVTTDGNDISAYVVSNAKKVLRDEELEPTQNKAVMTMAKNEYESTQFILNSDLSAFNVESVQMSALHHENGTDFISTDDIKIYRQHYMYVDVHYYTYDGFPDAYYPDALIETQYDYAHYTDGLPVAQGENQGYWITVFASSSQKEGLYTGTITAQTDKGTVYIPVECTVYNFALPTENHFKTSFANYGLNDYAGQREQYYDFLKTYRLNSTYLPAKDDANIYNGESYSPNADYYTAVTHAEDVRINSYFVNLNGRRGWTNDRKDKYLDYHFYDDFKSLISGLNAITPDKIYAITADEPSWQNQEADTTSGEYWANEIKWFTDLVKSEMPEINTMVTFDTTLPEIGTYDGDTMRYVPDAWTIKPSNLREGDAEDLHENGQELWFYTCNWPTYPAINTHIDSELIGARILSWMEHDYDIDGYFCFSCTTASRSTNDTHPDPNPWINPYNYLQGNSNGTGNSDPAGDGYVLMIGKEGDGIIDANVPVPTIRLEALRDSMEDYEYLYAYEQKLNSIINTLPTKPSANDAMQMFYDALYKDTSDYDSDVEKLRFTRDDLAKKLCEDVDFVYYITPGDESISTTRTIYVYSDGTKPVTINGTAVTGENGVYSLEVSVNDRLYRNDYAITVGSKTVYVHCYPDLVSRSDRWVDISACESTIEAANTAIPVSVDGDVMTASYSATNQKAYIPYSCLTGARVAMGGYTHLRMTVSADNMQIVPYISASLVLANGSAARLNIKGVKSGSVVDIPLTSSFRTMVMRNPTKFELKFLGMGSATVHFSNITLINKDVQDPALKSAAGIS